MLIESRRIGQQRDVIGNFLEVLLTLAKSGSDDQGKGLGFKDRRMQADQAAHGALATLAVDIQADPLARRVKHLDLPWIKRHSQDVLRPKAGNLLVNVTDQPELFARLFLRRVRPGAHQ